jgi:organic hydroperoxide reductase OsmC/OhrA
MADANTFEISLAWPAAAGDAHPHPDAAYGRNSLLWAADKPPVSASAPPAHGGDAARYNPEELLMLSLSQCHMLTFLAIASKKRIPVLRYEDRATGLLGITPADRAGGTPGKIAMQQVVLHPRVTVAKGFADTDFSSIHEKAHANCFMANSVNFPVLVEATVVEAD